MKAEYSTVTKNIVSVSFALLTIFATACGQRPWSAESVESELNIVGGQAVGSDVDDARRLSTVALTTDHRSARRTDNPHLFCPRLLRSSPISEHELRCRENGCVP
jgi:hypothetical protein